MDTDCCCLCCWRVVVVVLLLLLWCRGITHCLATDNQYDALLPWHARAVSFTFASEGIAFCAQVATV
jgi:hypothetical protein